MELFTLNKENGVNFKKYFDKNEDEFYKHGCAGKVNLVKNNSNIIGHAIGERNTLLWVQVEGLDEEDEIFTIKRPQFDLENWKCVVGNCENKKLGHKLTEHWPIRLLLNENGNCKFSFARLALDCNNKITANESC